MALEYSLTKIGEFYNVWNVTRFKNYLNRKGLGDFTKSKKKDSYIDKQKYLVLRERLGVVPELDKNWGINQ